MDCALRLRERTACAPRTIAAIRCRTAAGPVPRLWEPLAAKHAPPNGYAAKFSLPYLLAVILVKGRAGLAEFDGRRRCATRTVLGVAAARRLRARSDHRLSAPVRRRRRGHAGRRPRRSRERQDRPRGGPDAPLTRAELEAKFRGNAASLLPDAQVERVIRAVDGPRRRRAARRLCSPSLDPERSTTMTTRSRALVAPARSSALVTAPPPRRRTPRLEAAKKEGKVVWYTSLALPSAEKVAKLFEAAYPGIKVEVHRTGSQRILQRVMQELQANIKNVDVVHTSDAGHFVLLKDKKLLPKYTPAGVDALPRRLQGQGRLLLRPARHRERDRLQHRRSCPPRRRRRPGRTCSTPSGRASW